MNQQQQAEFQQLKTKLFGGHMFVVPDKANDTDWTRYNELMGMLQAERRQQVYDRLSENARYYYDQCEDPYMEYSIKYTSHTAMQAFCELERVGFIKQLSIDRKTTSITFKRIS